MAEEKPDQDKEAKPPESTQEPAKKKGWGLGDLMGAAKSAAQSATDAAKQAAEMAKQAADVDKLKEKAKQVKDATMSVTDQAKKQAEKLASEAQSMAGMKKKEGQPSEEPKKDDTNKPKSP